ncbi:methyl-accepting chemotaxis protein [Aquincola sp. J276]|uniref:methyl-accepting chemotaxis protein n=1 Tax=Aquincola sp. J276 TaxID=2898432 RepID=UPI00215156F0|nr:methyl-accepting chemotaxis protein [Aquincola sp. J276]MCR5868168.1 methyl-accepting chemotaxis protein [Aquincola sp. J276]
MVDLRWVSVRVRFHVVMALVSASLIGLGLWSWLDSRQASDGPIAQIFDEAIAASTEVGKLRESLSAVRRYEAAMVATAVSNPTDVEALHQAWKKEIEALKAGSVRLLAQNADQASLAELIAAQAKLLDDYVAIIDPVAVQLTQAKMDASAGLAYTQRAGDTLTALQANAAALLQAQHEHITQLRQTLADNTAWAASLRLLLVAGTLVVVLPLMVLTLRSICGPLDRAVTLTAQIARGDLTTAIDTTGQDEPAKLMQGLHSMQASLRHLVSQVRHSAASIEVASAEVASGNLDLSQRTEQAAQHLQSTASAMTELTHKVRQSADSAHSANELAGSAAGVAHQGGDVVTEVVKTMLEIESSSRQIAEIISTIDGIAFQTNILALNAAVEAARAGEQGRGFAVVAGEVRSLAKRSADAAKQIKSLIGDSVGRVDTGSRLVKQAGGTMGNIVGSVQRVRTMIEEITQVAGTQSQDLAQISRAIGELDQATQQNAALVEQSAAAAESLKDQAGTLSALVRTFRTGNAPESGVRSAMTG